MKRLAGGKVLGFQGGVDSRRGPLSCDAFIATLKTFPNICQVLPSNETSRPIFYMHFNPPRVPHDLPIMPFMI